MASVLKKTSTQPKPNQQHQQDPPAMEWILQQRILQGVGKRL